METRDMGEDRFHLNFGEIYRFNGDVTFSVLKVICVDQIKDLDC